MCEHNGCSCLNTVKPLGQSLTEVTFENGLWGLIIRDPSAAQVQDFVARRGREHVTLRDASGYTPLLYAARSGRADLCEVLLKLGANPRDATPHLQQTALHRAASNGHDNVVRLLVRFGARPELLDAQGLTALDLAVQRGHSSTAVILTEIQAQSRR